MDVLFIGVIQMSHIFGTVLRSNFEARRLAVWVLRSYLTRGASLTAILSRSIV